MSLDIPDEAVETARAHYAVNADEALSSSAPMRHALEAAVPLVVAGYLETLADEYELNAREADDRVRDHIDIDNQTGATIATVTSEINDAVADHLRELALELRGGNHG